MENNGTDPRTKADENNTNKSSDTPDSDTLNSDTTSESESDRRNRARNYKNGEDDIEGPDFSEDSEGADGDTTSNAGIFK